MLLRFMDHERCFRPDHFFWGEVLMLRGASPPN